MNSQTKILLIVFAGLLLVFLLYNRNSDQVSQENFSSNKPLNEVDSSYQNIPKNIDDVANLQDDGVKTMDTLSAAPSGDDDSYVDQNAPVPKEDMIKYFPQKDYSPPEADLLQKKFASQNKARPGEYKQSSYTGGRRGQLGPSNWNDYFDSNNNIIGNCQTSDNDQFLPIDESKGGFAVFKTNGKRAKCGSNQNCQPEDLFDVDKYLPQEVNDDWFEVQPEPISVKNRHLINITKPIGINTIGTSLKNASWDIRGTPSCPKFVVSPWSNSSIEPDTNLKPLY